MDTEKRKLGALLRSSRQVILPGVLAVCAAALMPGVQAFGVTVDTFDGSPVRLQTGVGSPLEVSSFVVDDSILGMERDLVLRQFTAEGHAQLLVGDFGGGTLMDLSLSSMTSAQAIITWDGLDGDLSLDPNGLGGVDLTADGSEDALTLSVLFSDLPVGAAITVFSGPNDASILEVSLEPNVDDSQNEVYGIAFSAFEILSGNGADFTNVGAIQLAIGGTQTAFDLQFDLLEQGAAAVVASPEANAMSLSLLGILAIVASGRLQRPTRRNR
ncbi:MAG: hypothetical protein WBF93_05130 [Pirellulales bacterium]